MKSKVISTRLSIDEEVALKKLCKLKGISISEFIRTSILYLQNEQTQQG